MGVDGLDAGDAATIVYCRSRATHILNMDITHLECAVTATADVLRVRFDWPESNPLPPRQWLVLAELTLGTNVDYTSAILVIVEECVK